MSFMIYRSKKLRKATTLDGDYIAEIEEIEPDKSQSDVWHVKFRILNGELINNRYIDDSNKYSALDALIDAALGTDSSDVDLNDLIGCYVKITVANEGRFTNVKRVTSLSEQEQEGIEGSQEENSDTEDEEDESCAEDEKEELDDEEPDDDELDEELEDELDDEMSLTDDSEPDFEKPRRRRFGSGLGRKRDFKN